MHSRDLQDWYERCWTGQGDAQAERVFRIDPRRPSDPGAQRFRTTADFAAAVRCVRAGDEMMPLWYSLTEHAYDGDEMALRPIGEHGDYRLMVGDAFSVEPMVARASI